MSDSQLSLTVFSKTKLINSKKFVEQNIKSELFGDVWKISFAGKYFVVIDLDLDMLFLNGERLLTTGKEKGYDELFVVRKNRLQQKTRFKTLFARGQVLAIDVGWDGRIFFKYWRTEKDYNTFRKAPVWVASYFNDRIAKKKFVWVQDLHDPKFMFVKGVEKE